MRPPQDLLNLPYSFTQLAPLTAQEFIGAARERGVQLHVDDLQAFHRLKLLVPMLRVQRDGRAVASLARRGNRWARQAGHAKPNTRDDLIEAHQNGRLFDPVSEPFIGRARLTRTAYGISYQASEYLYSHHQLLTVPSLRQLKVFLSYQQPDARAARLHQHAFWDLLVRPRLATIASLIIPLSALDPLQYPDLIGIFRSDQWEQYEQWRQTLRPRSLTRWLGVRSEWLKQHGAWLLREADSIDPMGDWHRLVREADPRAWESLKGDARSAVGLRLAAEILLSHYDSLAAAGAAPILCARTGRERTRFDTRLRPRGHVERTLTDFGLSPQPRLVLVVEGATELLLFPRLMAHFGIRVDREFIAIEDREGVTKDLAPLLAYAIAPPTELDGDGRYLRPLRPLTRLLVVSDAEGPMATVRQREQRRQIWIDRVMRTFPRQHATPEVRKSIAQLIFVDTWRRRGGSFEFAHFTDPQLGRALASIDQRTRQPTLADRISRLRELRRQHASVNEAIAWGSKLDLADALWPTLLTKITRAEKHDRVDQIPIVRILDRATQLANEFPRGSVVIPLKRASESS
jgi:hypothetical protein